MELCRSLRRGIATCLLWQTAAQGEPAPLSLRWLAPVDCPSGAEIEAEVLRLVMPKRSFADKLVADAKVELDENGRYRLTLHTTEAGVEGERSIEGQTCRAVSDAAIVTLALSLDPYLELPKGFGANQQVPTDPTAVALGPVVTESKLTLRSATVTPAVAPAPTTDLVVRSALGWRWGSLPESAGELGASLGLRRGRASAHFAFALSPTTTAHSQQVPNRGGTFTMQAGELAGCGALFDGRSRLSPCLGVALTRVAGEGFGVVPIRDGTLYWASVMAAIEASFALGRRVALYGSLGGYLALHRPYAYLSGFERIFQPDPLAYQLVTGAEIQIW